MTTFFDTIKIEDVTCPPDCLLCEEACLDRNSDKGCSGIRAIHLPELKSHTVKICNQCGEPACEENCPTGAIHKDPEDGIVRINEDKCLGCGLCSMVCPYGGIEYSASTKQSFKCDLCDGDPQCVDVCPHGILSFIKSREIMQYMHEEQFPMGQSPCPGCGGEISIRFAMKVIGKDTFLFGAPGCCAALICGWGTSMSTYVPSHMTNMTNLPATAAGLQRYYRKIGQDVRVVCIAGDGCFADVGFQSLSGAAERGENLIVICYDNEAFMNTGIQRSATSPFLGWTATTPVGKKRKGKQVPSKNLPLIMAAHQIPYVATANMGYPEDFLKKLIKAMAVKDGMSYIHLLSPCPTGWRFRADSTIDVCRAAVETNYFPLWEYDRGDYRITHVIDKPKPIREYCKLMGKFSHLDEHDFERLQELIDQRFAFIKSLSEI